MKRTQLSMFVSIAEAEQIERVRRVVDPVQARLIPAHVTLCREDELPDVDLGLLAARVASAPPISLTFDRVAPFSGHGILLHGDDSRGAFARLRQHVLGRSEVRNAPAHITLAHPRNPCAPGNSIEAVDFQLPMTLVFDRVMLIEQSAPGVRWAVLAEWPLGRGAKADQSVFPT